MGQDEAEHEVDTTLAPKKVAEKTRGGGLVSRRIEMYNAPAREPKPPTRQPPHDSFAVDSSSRPESREAREAREEEPSVDQDMNYIGSVLIESGVHHYAQGEYEKALKAFTTALRMQRVSVGDDHVCIAFTLGNLGAVYLQQGHLDEAERSLEGSLEMKLRLAPNMIVADTLNNLGNCANLRGDFQQSLMYYRESLRDLRRKRGRRRDVANALFNIGRLEIQEQEWDTAMAVLSEAWRITREVYGENNIFVAQTLDLIGFVQLNTSEYDAAMTSFGGALSIYRGVHGPLHMDVANGLFNVGMVREAKGELGDAWEAYTTSRDVYARLGTDHDHTGFRAVRRSIANVEREIANQQNQGRLDPPSDQQPPEPREEREMAIV